MTDTFDQGRSCPVEPTEVDINEALPELFTHMTSCDM